MGSSDAGGGGGGGTDLQDISRLEGDSGLHTGHELVLARVVIEQPAHVDLKTNEPAGRSVNGSKQTAFQLQTQIV